MTTIHGPLDGELGDIYTRIADRVPLIAISQAQRRPAPELAVACVIHRVDVDRLPCWKRRSRLLLVSRPDGPEKGANPYFNEDLVYVGEVDNERKFELLAGATALLFPIRWNEPFGMVMIEALACRGCVPVRWPSWPAGRSCRPHSC